MEKIKEEMLEKLRSIKQTAEEDLEANNFENYEVKNIIHFNQKVELINKESNKIEKFDLYIVVTENSKPEKGEDPIFEIEYLEDKKGNVYTIADLIHEYDGFESIKDVVDNAKENEELPEEEQDDEYAIDELNELEEKEQEEKSLIESEKKEEHKKIKPKYIIERVNPDKAKMDYWQNIKQAFGLPPEVHTLAFGYPDSSIDKVEHAKITVYMLDKDGYVIDDLNVNDYFEFDSSTGNNPMKDEVVRHEEDENKGKTQTEENRTMLRLKAKNGQDNNTYISLEQKNELGDYNDINAGRKTVAGTQNVEKQLETDRVRVWDSDREKLVKSNAGRFNMNEIFEEAEEHKIHGDEEYIHKENADGNKSTIELCKNPYIPGTEKTWEELSDETGESIKELQERFERELKKGKEPDEILGEIEYDYEMTGHEQEHRLF